MLSSGRPGLGIHESLYTDTGLSEVWHSYDIPSEHNKLMQGKADLQFCGKFEHAPLDGSLGWTQSSGVTSVQATSVGSGAFLVCYNRVCCPTVKTDCHVAPPSGCTCNGTDFFCMKGHVELD
jgi:hypothetical protein